MMVCLVKYADLFADETFIHMASYLFTPDHKNFNPKFCNQSFVYNWSHTFPGQCIIPTIFTNNRKPIQVNIPIKLQL